LIIFINLAALIDATILIRKYNRTTKNKMYV